MEENQDPLKRIEKHLNIGILYVSREKLLNLVADKLHEYDLQIIEKDIIIKRLLKQD